MIRLNKIRAKSTVGMTLVELLIALTIASFGMLAITTLFVNAMSANGRSKRDTTATLVAQGIMEQISLGVSMGLPTVPVTDCQNNVVNASTAGTAGGAGAALDANGNISFVGAAPGGGYSMTYTVCTQNGQTNSYDVRWNVQTLDVTPVADYMMIVKVAAQPNSMQQARSFVAPVTLKTIASLGAN